MVILGIDPGSRVTGVGIIKYNKSKFSYIYSGCVKTMEPNLVTKLGKIYSTINTLIAEYKPDVAVVEKIFVYKNVATALKLGQARGAVIASLADKNLELAEYTPREVKQAVVGYGAADKSQVQHMVTTLLNLSDTPQSDAADALAMAICHSSYMKREVNVDRVS